MLVLCGSHSSDRNTRRTGMGYKAEFVDVALRVLYCSSFQHTVHYGGQILIYIHMPACISISYSSLGGLQSSHDRKANKWCNGITDLYTLLENAADDGTSEHTVRNFAMAIFSFSGLPVTSDNATNIMAGGPVGINIMANQSIGSSARSFVLVAMK